METAVQKSIFQRVVEVIGRIFGPVIDILCASGLLKGVLMILSTLGILSTDSSTYQVLILLSDTFFYFLPIFLAVSASKVFQVNRYTALLLAAFLVNPHVTTFFESGKEYFFGLPIKSAVYTSSVLPILLSLWMMKYIEKILIKYVHESIRGMFVPLMSLLIILPITLFILGPVGNSIAIYVTYGYNYLMDFSLIIGMSLLAALFPLFIMFGISTAMAPVIINNLALDGHDTMLISLGCCLFALAGMSLSVYFKKEDLKSAALSGVITALLGVGEPSVFGVGLAVRKAFIICMLSALVGGGITGFFHAQATAFIIPNLVTLPAYIGQPGFVGTIIGCFIAFVMSFLLNFIFLKKNKV